MSNKMIIYDMFYTDTGRIISSFIVGLGLSIIFWNVCNGPECKIIKGHSIDSIQDKVFKFDSKCYTYSAVATSCKNKTTDTSEN